MQSQIHGWKIELTSHPRPEHEPDEARRKPELWLRKGNEFVRVRGVPGIDPEILLGRAVIEALTKDIEAERDPQRRRALEREQHRARADERYLQEERNPIPAGEEVVAVGVRR